MAFAQVNDSVQRHLPARSLVAVFLCLCLCVALAALLPAAADAVEYVAASGEPSQVNLQASKASAKAKIRYRVHVENTGWMSYAKNGAVAGKPGKGLRVEALRLKVKSKVSGSIAYRVLVQDEGWTKWARNGAVAGTTGKGLRAEMLRVKLTGKLAKKFNVYYRVNVRGIGWMGWSKNGRAAGTKGCSMPIVGVRMKLVAKGAAAPKKTADRYRTLRYSYSTKVQDRGWTNFVGPRKTSGTTGAGLRTSGLKVKLSAKGFKGSVRYSSYLEGIGWTSWVKNGKSTAKSGKSLRAEAYRVKLTGELAKKFDVYYRVHVENLGWLDWAKNGQPAGSRDRAWRAEAIRISIIPKGSPAPGPTSQPYYEYPKVDELRDKLALDIDYHDEFIHGEKPAPYQKYIVLHDTEGMGNAATTVEWWLTSGNLVAAHFVVNRDGTILQCVPLDKIAHHAGYGNTGHNDFYGVADESRDDKRATRWIGPYCADYGMNSHSVGIEMVHVGGGAAYTEAQLNALDDLIAYIDAYYGFESTIIDHKAWREGNSDTSPEFAGYLANYQDHRTHL